MPHTTTLVLYARWPRRGAVKSRLAARLGPDAALELHRAMLLDSIDLLRRVCGETVVPMVAFSEPDAPDSRADDPELAAALNGLALLPQRGEDLGSRLQETFRSLFERGFERVVIFGSYNLSRSAESFNDENLVVVNQAELAERFLEEFERVFDRAR